MSLLKHVDPVTGEIAEPDAPAHHADPRAAFHSAMQRVEDAFTVALKVAEDRAADVEARLAALHKDHEALQRSHAALEEKLAIVHELKAKLAFL